MVFFSIVGVGQGFLTVSVFGYITDCLGDRAPGAFAALNLTSLVTFGNSLSPYFLFILQD